MIHPAIALELLARGIAMGAFIAIGAHPSDLMVRIAVERNRAWKDLQSSFRKIARVLKPGARLSLVFRSTQHAAGVQAFPADVYRFPEYGEVETALATAGFAVDRQAEQELGARAHLLIATRLP